MGARNFLRTITANDKLAAGPRWESVLDALGGGHLLAPRYSFSKIPALNAAHDVARVEAQLQE
jgi:hypothetical protein